MKRRIDLEIRGRSKWGFMEQQQTLWGPSYKQLAKDDLLLFVGETDRLTLIGRRKARDLSCSSSLECNMKQMIVINDSSSSCGQGGDNALGLDWRGGRQIEFVSKWI